MSALRMKAGDLVSVRRVGHKVIVGVLIDYWNQTGWWEILTCEGIIHWPENEFEKIGEERYEIFK